MTTDEIYHDAWIRMGYVERKDCVVCNNHLTDVGALDFEYGQTILKCTRCSLGNTRYYPSMTLLPTLYEKSKDANSKQLDTRDFDFESIYIIEKAKDYVAKLDLAKIKTHLQSQHNAVIADFGAGNGRYSRALQQRFPTAKVVAIDFQSDAPKMIKDHHRIEYLSVKEFLESEEQYSAILLRHVLEHSINPLELLYQLKEKLAEGGIISVEVPNSGSRIAKWTKTKWVGHYLPRHITHYDFLSLKHIAEAAGLVAQLEKKNPPVLGNQICALQSRVEMSPILQILGGILHPLQLALELGKFRGAAITATFKKVNEIQ
jgi:2-polyprenyl-3-methyl-5-hydroxy-6-metoxy-1,4-benzoquinol methylase